MGCSKKLNNKQCNPTKLSLNKRIQLNILALQECLKPVEIQFLRNREEDDSSSEWKKFLCKSEKNKQKCKQLKRIRRCKESISKKGKSICELIKFMKVLKENLANVKRYGPGEYDARCGDTSLEPTFVLAHLSAKLLQFEKKIKCLNCTKNDTSRLVTLIKKVKNNIILQLICGPRKNEALFKSISDVAFIDCYLGNLVKVCHCPNNCIKLGIRNDKSKAFVETFDKCVNTDGILFCDKEVGISLKKEDKCTCYGLMCCKNDYNLNLCPAKYRHRLYTYRKQNCTKATEFGSHNQHLTYYYDVRQVNRCTSTSDISFKGDIVYPNEELCLKDIAVQTESCFTFNDIYEITTMCVTFTNVKTMSELNELPPLECVTNDVLTSSFSEIEKVEGIKTYMTQKEGINILAETNTDYNEKELTLIYNNDITTTHTVTGNWQNVNSKLITLKQQIFDQVKRVATQSICEYIKNKNRRK